MKTSSKAARPGRPTILLTNDDGFYRETIHVLLRALRPVGTAYIVAPDRERSACSLSVTLRRPLRAQLVHARGRARELHVSQRERAGG